MQTRRKQITQCRATTHCKKKVLEHGCFCVDHELIWIAKCGEPSVRIRTKHKKMYRQFQRQCEREFNALEDYRINQIIADRQFRLNQQADKLYRGLLKENLVQIKTMTDKLTGVDDVYDAALYSFDEHAQAPADSGDDQPRADTAAEGGASSGDWRLSTSAYGSVGEGQPEVPASGVHRSGK
jgi:hypothetical protein